MEKSFQNIGFSIVLGCVFFTVFSSDPLSIGVAYASFNDHTITNQDTVKVEFIRDPTKYISESSKPYLQLIGNWVVGILLILMVGVGVLAWLGDKYYKQVSSVILMTDNQVIKFIEKDPDSKYLYSNGKAAHPLQRGEWLCDQLLVVIDELQKDGKLKPQDLFLLDLYQITQKNLSHSVQHYLVTDFPTMIEKDLDRLLIGYNPFERWVSLITLIAPSLGFFGTVLGMMDVANVFAEVGGGSELNILPGLGVALVTTALGLILLFISSFTDHYFEYKSEKLRKKIMTYLSRINVFLFLTPSKVEHPK